MTPSSRQPPYPPVVDIKRLVMGPDLHLMTARRRLRYDLLYAVAALPFALLLGWLRDDDLTGYPLWFGGTWLVLGTAVAVGRFVMSRREGHG